MPVTEFRDTFLRLCKDQHIEPQECILNAIKSAQKSPKKSGGGRMLNLATHSLTEQTCRVLGKALATDRCFTEICFNDCMIVEEGVKAIANGLATNVACKKLDFKGNNIRATAAEALGRMLRQNTHMLSLCLEWNSLGMLDAAFGVFCEGLGGNTVLQILDLRNNQITHEGATTLGAALKRNTKLRAIDLRWNSIGLIGGRHLLHMLETNKTLVRLELAGNNIPNDVMKSIDQCIVHNADLGHMESDHHNRQHMMSQEIQNLRKDKVSEMSGVLDKMDRQEASMRASQRSSNQKIAQLQDSLEERRDQFNTIASKLALAESELALSESKVNELGMLLEKARDQQAERGKLHQADLKREREIETLKAKSEREIETIKHKEEMSKAVMEGKFNKEMIDLNDKNMQFSNKIDELERKCHSQQETIFELKEQLGHAHADYKLKSAHFDERVGIEKQKTKDAYRDAEELKHKEVERVKRESDDLERTLKDRISKLEMQRIELEEEVSRHKSSAGEERLRAEEQLMNTKHRIKAEEEARVHELEEKLRAVNAAKDDLQNHGTTQAGIVADLQGKNANLILENETLRRKIQDCNQEIAGKNSEIMAEVGKVKIEMNQRIQKLESERQTKSEMYDRIAKLERELGESQLKLSSTVQNKDAEINKLNELLRGKEMDLRQMREEETQRAALLTTAIQNYVSRGPKT